MWKLAFKDKMDDGNRVQELLGDLATADNGVYETLKPFPYNILY